jgi:hypothetical protein
MLRELLHNKVYAILLIFFTLAILMWLFNYFGMYEGMTSTTNELSGGANPSTTTTAQTFAF